MERSVWVADIRRGTTTRVTFDGQARNSLLWSPDGERIVFDLTPADSPRGIFSAPADGSGVAERFSTVGQSPKSWTTDGGLLAFAVASQGSGMDIWVLSRSDGSSAPFLDGPFDERWASFSPDGNWLAYVSDESGRFEVFVRPYPGPSPRYQVSSDGGFAPIWADSGSELFFLKDTADEIVKDLWAVDVTTTPAFATSAPRRLFGGAFSYGLNFAGYDISPDGDRFIFVTSFNPPTEEVSQVRVVLNWTDELKRLVPTND